MTLTQGEIEHELEQLHEESYAWALACCRQHVTDAEDVLQMTYLKVLDGSARFEGRSSFRTWLFGIIRRTAAGKWRTYVNQQRLQRLFFRQHVETSIPAIDDGLAGAADTRRLLIALHMLSKRQREVLLLVFYHDMTIEETAATLNIGLGSARTHYSRGKKKLAARLAGMQA